MFCPGFEIGLTVATMHPVGWYGIPLPSTHSYLPVSVVRQCGDMTFKGYGFPSAAWTWKFMSQAQLWNMLSLFTNDSDMYVNLYMRTYKDTGYDAELATFLCRLIRPLDGQGKALIPQTASRWTNVSARFVHLEEQ
jgi:hypothetical protein